MRRKVPRPSSKKENHMSRTHLLAAILCIILTSHLRGETAPPTETLPEITVTAIRPGLPLEQIGQSVSIVTREEIQLSGASTLNDVLRVQPALHYYSYGAHSTLSSISIRGMQPRHTKLLVDGVPYEDVSSTQVAALFGNIPAAFIERIEIVKGPTSLAGSSAMGGVINIVTRRPAEDGLLHGELSLTGGSHGKMGANALFYGQDGDFDYAVSLGRTSERGISAVYRAWKADGTPENAYDDDDSFRGIDSMLRLGWNFAPDWRLELSGAIADQDEEYDTMPEDGNIRERHLAGRIRLSGNNLLDGNFSTSFTLSALRIDRRYQGEDSKYRGDEVLLNWQGTYQMNDNNSVTIGLEREIQRMQHWLDDKDGNYTKGDDKRYRINSAYIAWHTSPLENLDLNLTGRATHNSDFGTEWTGDISGKYRLADSGFTIHGALGKGYRQPTLFELVGDVTYYYYGYGTRYQGNPDLKPESNLAWEAGITHTSLAEALTIDMTYFQSRTRDYIDTTGLTPVNLDKIHLRGVEVTAKYQIDDIIAIYGGYTWQSQRNLVSGLKHLPCVPTHSFAFGTTFKKCFLSRNWEFDLGGIFCGSRRNQQNMKMNDYLLMYASATWHINDNLKLTLRADNLLNERYQDCATWGPYGMVYNTAGRNYTATLTWNF
jgi:vitamin B12 transporter